MNGQIDIKALGLGVALLALSENSLAGAWTLPPGGVHLEFYGQRYRNAASFDASGESQSSPNGGVFTQHRAEVKAEIGVASERINLLFAMPYSRSVFRDRNVELRSDGVEFFSAGLKYRFTRDTGWVVSGQLGVAVPACEANAQPPLGDCVTDSEARVIVSTAFSADPITRKSRAYVSAEGGYRWRSGAPADEAPYYLEGAFNIGSNVWAKLALDGVFSRALGGPGAIEDYHKWTAALSFSNDPARISRDEAGLGLEVSYGETYRGRNTGTGKITALKIFYRF